MKKIVLIACIIAPIMIVISSITAIYFIDKQEQISYDSKKVSIDFSLNDKEYKNVEINSQYEEKGAQISINKKEDNKNIEIDSSNIDITKKGKYYVTYKYKVSPNRTLTKYRLINVVDTTPPEITLKGKENERVEEGSNFVDEGFEVIDNSKEELTDKVEVTSNVDTSKAGKYEIKYTVADSSENKIEKIRNVTVYKKVKMVKVANTANDKGADNTDFNYNNYDNTVTKMSFTNYGFSLEGFNKYYNGNFQIKISGNGIEKIYDMTKNGDNKYKGSLDITSLSNGTYDMYVITDKVENLKSELPLQNKIVRAKVGNKLVTVNYINNNIQFNIENFAYQYDIVIDPGHGGSDSGAVNSQMQEKELNLIQSLYEKKRYEDHGLNVLMIRNDDSMGLGMGPNDWPAVRRRAYAMGYYGSVSRIIYSNHHNSFGNNVRMGWEIILPNTLSKSELSTEYAIANEWRNMYPLTESHTRIYGRDYDSETIKSKENGEVYNYINYYAVMRLTYDLYNVKSVLYEGCYMSNSSDFNWYYNEGNYKKLSEVKIKHYVEQLGKTYIPPTN